MSVKRVVMFPKERAENVTNDKFELKQKTDNVKLTQENMEGVVDGEIVLYEDYEYRYNMSFFPKGWKYIEKMNGWGVRVIDKNKSSYSNICGYIKGKPVIGMTFAFWDCENIIETPRIPETVRNIFSSFEGCKNLKAVINLPEGIISMNYSFMYCENLEEIPQIPSSVKNMDFTFYECKSLENIPNIPRNVTNLNYT